MHIKPAFAGRAQHLATVLAAVVIFFAGFAVGDQRMIGAAHPTAGRDRGGLRALLADI